MVIHIRWVENLRWYKNHNELCILFRSFNLQCPHSHLLYLCHITVGLQSKTRRHPMMNNLVLNFLISILTHVHIYVGFPTATFKCSPYEAMNHSCRTLKHHWASGLALALAQKFLEGFFLLSSIEKAGSQILGSDNNSSIFSPHARITPSLITNYLLILRW